MSHSEDTSGAPQTEAEIGHQDADQGPWTVTVDNQDTGRDIVLHVGRGETVQKAIDDLYEALGRSRDPKDRLTCAKGGVDVFQFAAEKIKDYVQDCPALAWNFSGPTGGASACLP